MAEREQELTKTTQIQSLRPPSFLTSELNNWFPREFYPEELIYRLGQTSQFKEHQASGEKSGTRLSISQIEKAVPWLFKRLGYDVVLPTFPQQEIDETPSIIGTALHEANVLFTILSERVKPEDIDKRLPSNDPTENEPYRKIAARFQISPNAAPSEVKDILCSAWEAFHTDPDLVAPVPMEPLIKRIGLKDPGFELEVRKGPLVLDLGRKLAENFAQRHEREESKEPYPTYNEVMIIANLICGLQLTLRLDSISAVNKKGKMLFLVNDLKTGRRVKADAVAKQVHDLQSGIMVVLSERFGSKFLKTGFIKDPAGEVFLLYNVDHNSQTGSGSAKFTYNWFDKTTGEVDCEEVKIEDRNALRGRIEWLGQAVNVFKPDLKDYLRTGVYKEGRIKIKKKQKGKPADPFGLVQQEMDFNRRPEVEEQEEFEKIINDLNRSIKPQSPRERRNPRETYRIGLFETLKTCGQCGGNIVRDCKLEWRRKLTSWISVEERCGSCGKVSDKEKRVTVFNKNIIS